MGREPKPQAGSAPAGSNAPVQRVIQDRDGSVPPQWLREAEHQALAERVDRLEADYELVTGLAFARFEGPDYDYFATELARYGMAVMAAWIAQGTIFGRCRERGYGGLPELGRPFDPDEVKELTYETVAKALDRFRADVLLTKKWDYRKGASLRTYFIGQCLIRFANIYRRWWGGEVRNRALLTDGDTLDDYFLPRRDDISGRAVDGVLVEAALASVKDPRVRQAMVMTAAGRTQAEIATSLGVTVKAVERMLANQRDRLRRKAG